MVCLESAILDAPSLFTDSLIDDPSNAFIRIIPICMTSGFENLAQDYWNSDNMIRTAPSVIDPTNMRSMKYILRTTVGASMSHMDEAAKFLCDFIFKTKAFRCFGSYYLNGSDIK